MDHRFCTECGTRLPVSAAYCTECGTALGALPTPPKTPLPPAPVPPPPPAPVPPPPPVGTSALPPAPPVPLVHPVPVVPVTPRDADSRTWLGKALLVSALALVLVLLGVGGAVVRLSGDDEPAPGAASAVEDRADAADTPAPATASPTASPTTPAPDRTPAPTPEEPGRVCWDGSAPPGCTAPTGPAGLRYLLPDFDFAAENCPDLPVRIEGQRRFRYDCASGGPSDPVRYGFSEFDTFGKAYGYHNKLSGVRPRRVGDFQRWDYLAASGEYKTALVYAGKTWGVTVYSYSAAQRDDAVLALIRDFRPLAEFKGNRG